MWDKDVATIFDISLADPVRFDVIVHDLWLRGMTAEQAAQHRTSLEITQKMKGVNIQDELEREAIGDQLQLSSSDATDGTHRLREHYLADTIDQYRFFQQVEPYLHNPSLFQTLLKFQLSFPVIQKLLERYYALDPKVIRELVGKKLTMKVRRDLDDVSEKTGVSLVSCLRQFDNLRRIAKSVDEKAERLHSVISEYMLPHELSQTYARVIFLCSHVLDTSKRKLQILRWNDYDFFASVFMSQWADEVDLLDFSDELTSDIRSLKAIMMGDRDFLDTYRSAVRNHCSGVVKAERIDAVNNKFSTFVKNLLLLGSSLQTKEFRNFTLDLIEKVGEPLVKAGMTSGEVESYFASIRQTYTQSSLKDGDKYEASWVRLLMGIQACVMQIYDNIAV